MKKVIFQNTQTPFSLHDQNIIAFEINQNDLILRPQSPAFVETTPPYRPLDGHLEFHNVDWDFCYAYILDFTGNVGTFSGEKVFLKDFIADFHNAGFSVMDETFGYNQTKLNGYFHKGRSVKECMIEIYHLGEMIYVVDLDD